MNKTITNIRAIHLLLWLISVLLFSTACQQQESAPKTESPYQAYRQNIMDTLSADNQLLQDWLSASKTVLKNPITIHTPFQAQLVYFNDESNAWSWKFSATEGRSIQAKLNAGDASHNVFLDLFALHNDDTLLVASQQNAPILYQATQSQTYLLRMQTELDVNGSFTLQLTDQPSMIFPVAGGRPYDIGGKWGDPRDGGDRYHQGIDIFAERHTPAVAAADGWISKAGVNDLGGKVVWLNTDHKSLYYAHLDSMLIKQGEVVQAGDTLGLVGSTGNAESTPPHLHFGIYDYRSAVDPLPYIDDANTNLPAIEVEPTIFNKWGRLQAGEIQIRPDPYTENPNLTILNDHDSVKVVGGTESWYHIQLSDGQNGFVSEQFLEPAPITSTQTDVERSK